MQLPKRLYIRHALDNRQCQAH